MTQNILALDLGTRTGWAMSIGEKDPTKWLHGVMDLKEKRYEGGGMRYLRFRRNIQEIHNTTPLHALFFEEVRRHLGTDAAHTYGGFLAILTSWCVENNVPFQGIPVGTIKKYATDKGNASKEEMIEKATALTGVPVTDDNAADAIHILRYAMDNMI